MPEPFRVIAHRGASAHAPENTFPAFEAAIDLGSDEVELDIRFSADDEIIVFHDDTLDAKTNRSGRVRHYDAATLRRTDIGSWFDATHPEAPGVFSGTCLIGLEELFGAFGAQIHYHIEIKGWEDLLPLRLLQKIDDHQLRERVTVTSFSMKPLVKMRSICPSIPICFLLRDVADAIRSAEYRTELVGRSALEMQQYWIDAAAKAGFQQVGIRASDATQMVCDRAAERRLEVRGWGVRDAADLMQLVSLGVVGATVDWPDRAIEILDAPT